MRITQVGQDTFEVRVPADSGFFDGHFPGLPVLPGVAQLGAVLEAHRLARGDRALAGIPFFRLRSRVGPGDLLVIRLSGDRFEVTREGQRVAHGTLQFEP